MAVYRFRVFIEDDHEVYRDIELQGKQLSADDMVKKGALDASVGADGHASVKAA